MIISIILVALGLVCFIMAAVGAPRAAPFNTVAAGLAFCSLAWLIAALR